VYYDYLKNEYGTVKNLRFSSISFEKRKRMASFRLPNIYAVRCEPLLCV